MTINGLAQLSALPVMQLLEAHGRWWGFTLGVSKQAPARRMLLRAGDALQDVYRLVITCELAISCYRALKKRCGGRIRLREMFSKTYRHTGT